MHCKFIVLCLFFSSVLVVGANAQNNFEPEFKKFEIRVGAFLTQRNTGLRLLTENGVGGQFNFEDDLGFDSETFVGRVDIKYRHSKRHQIDFSYFSLSRDASRIIDRSLQIGGQLYNIDTTISTETDIDIFKASYTYMFIAERDYEFGASLGLFMQKNKARFSSSSINKVISESVTLPLPVIGVNGRYDFNDRWHAVYSAETFFITIDQYSGSLFDLRGAVEFDFRENISLGVGYNWIKIAVDIDREQTDWNMDWRVSGVLGYVKLAF